MKKIIFASLLTMLFALAPLKIFGAECIKYNRVCNNGGDHITSSLGSNKQWVCENAYFGSWENDSCCKSKFSLSGMINGSWQNGECLEYEADDTTTPSQPSPVVATYYGPVWANSIGGETPAFREWWIREGFMLGELQRQLYQITVQTNALSNELDNYIQPSLATME